MTRHCQAAGRAVSPGSLKHGAGWASHALASCVACDADGLPSPADTRHPLSAVLLALPLLGAACVHGTQHYCCVTKASCCVRARTSLFVATAIPLLSPSHTKACKHPVACYTTAPSAGMGIDCPHPCLWRPCQVPHMFSCTPAFALQPLRSRREPKSAQQPVLELMRALIIEGVCRLRCRLLCWPPSTHQRLPPRPSDAQGFGRSTAGGCTCGWPAIR